MKKPVWFRRLVLLDRMIEECIYSRASGEVFCPVCKKMYYDHPNYLSWLTLLCDGKLVHL